MKKLLLGLLAILSLPAAAYDQNSVPTVNGLHLGDSYSQVVSILGNGEAFPMEPGVISMMYETAGLSIILSEQAGINRIEQIDANSHQSGSVFGVQVGQTKDVVEQLVGPLSFADTDDVNNAVLVGRGWRIHFMFDARDILQKFVLVVPK
jgi:hypothetical protein